MLQTSLGTGAWKLWNKGAQHGTSLQRALRSLAVGALVLVHPPGSTIGFEEQGRQANHAGLLNNLLGAVAALERLPHHRLVGARNVSCEKAHEPEKTALREARCCDFCLSEKWEL